MSADNEKTINFFIEAMKGQITIFLGAGASMEGVNLKGERFPSFNDIQKRIIGKFGSAEQRKSVSDGSYRCNIDDFINVLNECRNNNLLHGALREILSGKPGLAHYQLASVIVSGGDKFYLILTSNYDNLFYSAAFDICKHGNVNIESYSPQEIGNDGASTIDSLTRQHPILIKLFGDAGLHKAKFEEIELIKVIIRNEALLKPILERTSLFIGYSFSDENLSRLFLKKGGPIFIVDPNLITLKSNREIYQFVGTFGQFMSDLLVKLQSERDDLRSRVDYFLRFIDPETKFHRVTEVVPILQNLNDRGLGVVEERIRLKGHQDDRHEFLIERLEAVKWVEGFMTSDSPLMLLLGESGFGKSCFLYTTATRPRNDAFVSFFAGSTLVGESGFFGRIRSEFAIPADKIKPLFHHLDSLFSKEGPARKWLIIVDGLNECPDYNVLWEQIVTVAGWNLKNIKILYSCRTIFWESRRLENRRCEKLHYSGWTCKIGAFSPKETELAYDRYRTRLNISTKFADIEKRVRDHMANPLMMRMIVLTYSGEKLLEYIPATSVFDRYWDHLEAKSLATNSALDIGLLKVIAEYKVRNFEDPSVNRKDTFHIDDFIGAPAVTSRNLQAWHDEGVLAWTDERKETFRFSFDRFYEYCLSRFLIRECERRATDDVVAWVLKKYRDFESVQAHFSFKEALKSVLNAIGLSDRDMNLSRLVELILSSDDRTFAQQCLRELLFETDRPVIEALEDAKQNASLSEVEIYAEAQLTIAANSSKVISPALKGIFSGDDQLAHRCIQLLLSLDIDHMTEIDEKSADILINTSEFDESAAKGIANLFVFRFCHSEYAKDPMRALIEASGKYFGLVSGFPQCRATSVRALAETIRRWGPNLFSTTSREGENPFDYPWKRMGDEERAFALRIGAAIGKDFEDLTEEDFEAIRFFSMEVPAVRQMEGARPDGLPKKYPVESLLSRWVFIRHGKSKFSEIVDKLDRLMRTNDFCSSDFCICVLADTIMEYYDTSDPEYRDGYEQLKKWVEYFEKYVDGFYDVLNRHDAFTNTYNPLEETALVYSHLNPEITSNVFLNDWISSDLPKKRKLGLLAARRLWKRTGIQALNSVTELFQAKDDEIYEWMNRFMKEVSLFDRRLYERYISDILLPQARIKEIENTESKMARVDNYSATTLARMLLMHGRGRVQTVTRWHREIYSAKSLDEYLTLLTEHIFDWQREAYLNQQPAFRDP